MYVYVAHIIPESLKKKGVLFECNKMWAGGLDSLEWRVSKK